MAKINKAMTQKIGSQSVELEVDLEAMFDGPVPDSTAFRQSVGQAILDKIVKRTEASDFLNKSASHKYSKEYEHSLEFKAHGKKAGDKVNLKLTGDMLGLMDIISEDQSKITIGWTDDQDNAKAFNHVTGDTVPKRNFLGLPIDDLKSIAKDFKDQLPSSDETSTSSVDLFNKFVDSSANTGSRTLGQIIKGFTSGEGEG